MSFERLIGQERLTGFIRAAIRHGRLSHALLIVGPKGSGKLTLARELAKALLCERAEGDPCDDCRACRLIEHGNHPDVTVLARDAEHAYVRIEEARALTEALSFKPFMGRRKVAVLPEAHLLTEGAANALLKTLEEPPGDSVVLLLADSAAEILPTIRSRCQALAMQPLAPAVLAQVLERDHGLPADQARYAAAMSAGSLGRALELAEPDWYDMKRWVVEQFAQVRADGAFAVTDELTSRAQRMGGSAAAAREVLCRALDFAAALYRDAAAGDAAPPVHADQADLIPRGMDPLAAVRAAERLLAAQAHIRANAHPGLVLDTVLLDVAGRR